MGLDTVELVMAFEEAFDIEVPDEVAANIVTVRDAIDFIYSQVQHADAGSCRTQHAFYRLRRTTQDVLGVERARARPTTEWATVIPMDGRNVAWQQLKAAVGARNWPGLKRSGDVSRLITAFAFGSAATAFAVAPAHNMVAAACAGLLSAWALLRATAHWRVHFERANTTIGQVAELLATDPAWRSTNSGWTRSDVRKIVRRITAEHLGLDQTFSDDAAFVDDLGAD